MKCDFIVTVSDLRYAIGKKCMCVKGAVRFCKTNNIDWKDFLKNGIPYSELSKFDDEMIKSFLSVCRERRNGRR